MDTFKKLKKREKYFFLILFFGFMFKYNFLLFRIFYVPSVVGIILRNIVFILLFIYIVSPLTTTVKGRKFLYFSFLFFTILFVSNYWYNSYYGNYLSITDMMMGQRTGDFSVIEVFFRHVLNIYELLFLVDIAILPFLIPDKSNTKNYSYSDLSFFKKKKPVLPVILILVVLFTQILTTNLLLGNQQPASLYRDGSSEFVNVYGLLPLYAFEIIGRIAPYRLLPEEEPAPLVLEAFNASGNLDFDTNIIVIQWEALDQKIIDYEYNGVEITPFMNRLKERSIYFNNFYAQHINGSFDAELSFLTSLYPVNKNYTFIDNDMSKFDSLIKVLNDRGYQTMAFHGNDREFYSRDMAFQEIGFDHFYARDNFSEEDLVIETEKTTLGINDYDFFKQSVDIIEQAEEPFFSFLITVTSHTPFNFIPESEKKEEFMSVENRLLENYFHSLSFVDKSLEMFFDELEKRGLKENTLIIIYSDHEASMDTREYSSARNFNLKRRVKHPHNIPLFIFHPELKPGTIETTGSLTDLAPTILDLLQAEEMPAEFVGHSLFGEKERPVLFINEIPQVLYNGHLFARQRDEFIRIGYLDEKENKDIQIPEEEKDNIFNIIDYMKNIFFTRIRKDD